MSPRILSLVLVAACAPKVTSPPVVRPPPPAPVAALPVDVDASGAWLVARITPVPWITDKLPAPMFRSDLIAVDPVRRLAVVRHMDQTFATVDVDARGVVEQWRAPLGTNISASGWYPRTSERAVPLPVFDVVKRDREVRAHLEGIAGRLANTDAGPQYGHELPLDVTKTGALAFGVGDLLYVKRRPAEPARLMFADAAYDGTLSPDGESIAFTGCSPRCPQLATFIAATATGRTRMVPGLRGWTRAIWSPNGARVYFTPVPFTDDERTDLGCLYVVDPVRLTRSTVSCRTRDAPMQVAVSQDRARAAFVSGGELRWIDLDSGAELAPRIVLPASGFRDVRLTAAGRFAGFTGSTIVLADFATGATAVVKTTCRDGRWLSERELLLSCDGPQSEHRIPADGNVVYPQSAIDLRVLDVPL